MGKCIPLLALAAMMTATLAMPSAQAETPQKRVCVLFVP